MTPSSEDLESVKALSQQALHARERGDFARAAEIYQQALEIPVLDISITLKLKLNRGEAIAKEGHMLKADGLFKNVQGETKDLLDASNGDLGLGIRKILKEALYLRHEYVVQRLYEADSYVKAGKICEETYALCTQYLPSRKEMLSIIKHDMDRISDAKIRKAEKRLEHLRTQTQEEKAPEDPKPQKAKGKYKGGGLRGRENQRPNQKSLPFNTPEVVVEPPQVGSEHPNIPFRIVGAAEVRSLLSKKPHSDTSDTEVSKPPKHRPASAGPAGRGHEPGSRDIDKLSAAPRNQRQPRRHSASGRESDKTRASDDSGPYIFEEALFFDARPGEEEEDSKAWFRDLFQRETVPMFGAFRKPGDFRKGSLEKGKYRTDDKRKRRVRIAIIDTGIDEERPEVQEKEIRDRIRGYWCGVDNEPASKDFNGHGTRVALLLLQMIPSADIYIARVFTGPGVAPHEHIAAAIDFACAEWEVDIINMSLGFAVGFEDISDAITKASTKDDVLIFAAAANHGGNRRGRAFPARMQDDVFCIYATDGQGNKSKFNPTPMPGVSNFSTLGENVPIAGEYHSGTSYAAPIAAGTAALILEFTRQPALGQYEIKYLSRVATFRGMRALLESRGELRDGYYYIPPWHFLSLNVRLPSNVTPEDSVLGARIKAAEWISNTMQQYLGLE